MAPIMCDRDFQQEVAGQAGEKQAGLVLARLLA
jgi:hypothetical protein